MKTEKSKGTTFTLLLPLKNDDYLKTDFFVGGSEEDFMKTGGDLRVRVN